MMKSVSPWTQVIIFSALAAILLTLVAGDAQVRVVVVLWFFLVCPGMMLMRFFRLGEPVIEWMLAITLSLVADAFVAGVFLYAGKWSPAGTFATLLALTVGGAILHEVADARAQRGTSG